MKILCQNLNFFNITCDDKHNKRKHCDCISLVVPSKKNGWVK